MKTLLAICHCTFRTPHPIREYHSGRRHLRTRLFQTVRLRHQNAPLSLEKTSLSGRFSERIRWEHLAD